jgi:asparagine synthase (glutamine-hydrolysing)
MSELISHRGPDGNGVFISGSVGLAHRRLAVIDIECGAQPMTNDISRQTIVFNGEIYNYRELRKTLLPGSHRFHTDSDTEVLLTLADVTKTGWLQKLIGMFAFCIWDEDTRTIMLARDRFGKKPLYYTMTDEIFLFSSEIKPLLSHPEVQPAANLTAIPEYLAFRTVSGTATMFKDIREAPPGHVMLLKLANWKLEVRQYWDESDEKDYSGVIHSSGATTREEQFTALLKDSIHYRLVSDVPVGTYNSGGVDSSLITAMVREQKQDELHTFSVGFNEQEFDESRYAMMVANKYRTNHHTIVINEEEYNNSLDETLWYIEEPLNHAHTVPLLHLSRLAKEYVTVVLTGEGADEVFAGYPRFHVPMFSRYLSILPDIISLLLLFGARRSGNRKLIKLLETTHDLRRSMIESARYVPAATLDRLFIENIFQFPDREQIYDITDNPGISLLERMLRFDRKTYLPALLNRLDKVSMAAGLEARTPFLDHRFVNWSQTVPSSDKLKLGRSNKVIVKKVAEDWLPQEIIHRPKVGFGVPLADWFRNSGGLGGRLDILLDETYRQRSYVDHKSVSRLIKEHLDGRADHNEILWGLLNLEMWFRRFIDQPELSGP